MRVVILGQGRLGRSLLVLLPRVGIDAVPWRRGEPVPEGEVYWVTVSDPAIPAVAALVPVAGLVLHAAGALGAEVLGDRPERGVLHPLMSFPGPEVGLPALQGAGARVEGTPRALAVATELARALGLVPFELRGDLVRYHLAATVASSHVAAVLLDAARHMEGAGVPREEAARLLLPLALESLRRAAEGGTAALTGPAVRGDEVTIMAHSSRLDGEDRTAYELLTRRVRAQRWG